MAPTPQEHAVKEQDIMSPEMNGDRIVISGMSGLYPKCHNIKEFSNILYNKENPISSDDVRWQYSHPEVAQHSGNVPELDRFDAQFFKVHHRLAFAMDPMSRKILEQAHNAIYDAGVNSGNLSGRKIGVFIGSCFSETEKAFFYDAVTKGGYSIAGCSKSMFANRISYWLNAKGPSVAIDGACCSSAAALEQAYQAMTRGECEAALVGGSYLCLHPQSSVHYGRIIKQAKDGKTKSFDENADGCAKSEAINVLFLQKAKDALRVYAEVLHVKTEFIGVEEGETGPKYGFLRNPEKTVQFLKRFYEEAGIPPHALEYVEACGCAMPDADKVELEAIDSVICKGKENALLVGSVTSNIGYVEAATGISGVTKVLLGYHTGQLAANLHCKHPRQDIEALREGRMKIVTDHQKFGRSYAAVNGLSVTGMNSHILLHGFYKPKDLLRYKSNIPHLVTLSARYEDAVTNIINDLKSRAIDPEELALFHNIHQINVSDHLGRGYVILDTNKEEETVSLADKVEYFNEPHRPLWFVYSGMGSQWTGMGTQLMRISIFAAAIERCRKVLEPKGVDIVNILTTEDDKIFDNILNSFVGIAAVQIGLTDVLRELGLVPDGIIGHSLGELGCAYADGCLTAEEMILAAYSRGLVSLQTPFIRGSMAAVGLGYEKMSKLIPPEIEVACHNGPESSTISGPSDIMNEFVAELTTKGIFAKEVPCSNIAFHSRYIADAGPVLRKYLKEVIKSPRKRTERWVSTSVPKDRWNTELAQYSSAEYHTNNLLNPVLFHETLPEIPANAVLVEVAPHGLLQAILKRSLPESCENIALTQRKHPDNVLHLLQAVGNLHMAGYNPKVQNLYPKIEMPVSTGTPFLSHSFGWAHEEIWPTATYQTTCRRQATVCNWIISLHDKEYQYLQGNVCRKTVTYPFAAALVAVWDTLAMTMEVPKKKMSVEFRDVSLYVLPVLHDQSQLRIRVQLNRGNGQFEVLNEEILIASGTVIGIMVENHMESESESNDHADTTILNSKDIYDLLEERGHSYSGEFRCIERANTSLTEAELVWNDNWVTFIDGLIQLNALKQVQDNIPKLKQIRYLYIQIKKHELILNDLNRDKPLLKAEINETYNSTSCGGVKMRGLRFHNIPITAERKFELQTEHGDTSVLDDKLRAEQNSNDVILKISQVGDLESLHWADAPEVVEDNLLVDVHFASISNNDLKKANGTIKFEKDSDNCFGMEFSGITKNGERVMGIVSGGAASNQVRADTTMLWPVPTHWSLEEAATVPLAYIQMLYVMVLKCNIFHGCSVLIHGGCGAMGQAAIAVALSLGCQVFTTVSDRKKKEFLLKMFPELKEKHLGNSRDDSFADMVLNETKGLGCNYVISNVIPELKNAACRCVSKFGFYIDISQLHTQEHFTYGMAHLDKDHHYDVVDLSSIFMKQDMKKLQFMLSEGIARGYVRPLSRVVFSTKEPTRAFRLLAVSNHRGRVLINMKDSLPPATIKRISCKPQYCQLILYNEEKVGLQVAERLVNRGAKRIHLHNANHSSAKLQYKIRSWQNNDVIIQTTSGNFNTLNVENLINIAKNLGAIEGIYSVIGADQNINESLFTALDSTSRIHCSSLRYFAIVTGSDTVRGLSTCITRISDKLPAAMISLADLIKTRSYHTAMDAMEQALQLPDAVLRARGVHEDKPTLLQQIVALAGITIAKDTPKTTTLEELGINNTKLDLIATFLRNIYNMSLADTDVPLLTLKTIMDLENSELAFEDVKGLEAFFSQTDSDELMATTDMVQVATMTGSKLRDDEFDASQSYLFIIPGMEGHHGRFHRLCERLKLSAFVLQPGLDHSHETVQDTAKRFAELLKKKTGLKDEFYLLGYESGILVALEMAKMFEEQGITGTVYCIGYTPDELKIAIDEQLSDYKTVEHLQDALVLHIYKLMTNKDPTELHKALENTKTWHEKVDICVRLMKGLVSNSLQYISTFVKAALVRIEQVRQYKFVAYPLRSRLVLLRPDTQRDVPAITSLQQHSQQPVVVHQLRLPLTHATQDARCAAIINSYLNPQILQNYENKNVCEAYLTNNNCFMNRNS